VDKRYGFVGILLENPVETAPLVQTVLTEHASIIQGRMGVPHMDNSNISVITLIVSATTDALGSLTGKLGRISGVSVKSGLCKASNQGDFN